MVIIQMFKLNKISSGQEVQTSCKNLHYPVNT